MSERAGYAVFVKQWNGDWREPVSFAGSAVIRCVRYPGEDHARRVAYQHFDGGKAIQIRHFPEESEGGSLLGPLLIEELHPTDAGHVRQRDEFKLRDREQQIQQFEERRIADALRYKAAPSYPCRSLWAKWLAWAKAKAGRTAIAGPVRRIDRCYNCGRKPWYLKSCPCCKNTLCCKRRCGYQHYARFHPERHNELEALKGYCPCPLCKRTRGCVVNQLVSQSVAEGVF